MASNLEERVALVTGGGRGIGRAISLGLAADGADVALGVAALLPPPVGSTAPRARCRGITA